MPVNSLILLRHGERVDDIVPNWLDHCTQNWCYMRLDLNMVRFKIDDRMRIE